MQKPWAREAIDIGAKLAPENNPSPPMVGRRRSDSDLALGTIGGLVSRSNVKERWTLTFDIWQSQYTDTGGGRFPHLSRAEWPVGIEVTETPRLLVRTHSLYMANNLTPG